MSNFAKVNGFGIVEQVIVAESDFINSLPDATSWVQTSYNTIGGVHVLGGTPFRKNYAGIGYKYDSEKDAFIPQKPYDSWVLNQETCLWEAPVPCPNDGNLYVWNEETLQWDQHVEKTDFCVINLTSE